MFARITRRPGYGTTIALALAPAGLGLALAHVLGSLWLAAGVGLAAGLGLGLIWLIQANTSVRVVLAFILGVFAPTCGARMSDDVGILIDGDNVIALAEIDTTTEVAFVVDDANVRPEYIGHDTFEHHVYGTTQRFVAPLAPADAQVETLRTWVGCKRSSEDIPSARQRCIADMKQNTLHLRLDHSPSVFKTALGDALTRHHIPARRPRVYELVSSPTDTALENVLPLMAIVLAAALGAVVTTFRRRRDAPTLQ